ncbi:MAG: MFS transporter [Phycisphaerae bacterium]|nr:MFS transporter [Phycisphaerae bacterium]
MTRQCSDSPFAPRRWPFFYGWFILAAGTLGAVFSVPGQTIGVSAFNEPLMDAMGLDRMGISFAYMLGTVASSFLLTWVGRFYDRFGARVTAGLASAALGAVLIALSRMDAAAAAIGRLVGRPESVAVAFGVAVVGFFLLRFVGQGVLTLSCRNMVMKWFDHRRGLANGIMNVFVPPIFAVSPLLFALLIDRFGWSGTWRLAGAVIGAGLTVFVLVFFRDNPESCGLLPDGGATARPRDPRHHPARDFDLPEARRTYAFWVFNLALAAQALYLTAITFHVEDLFAQRGYGRMVAFMQFSPSAALAVVTGFVGGWISDHVRLKWILVFMLTMMGLSMVGALALGWGPAIYLHVAARGLSVGVFGLLLAMTWPRLFGRTHLGAISGFNMTWIVLFSAIGPAAFGLSKTLTGGYVAALALCLAAVAILALLALRADRPEPPEAPTEA